MGVRSAWRFPVCDQGRKLFFRLVTRTCWAEQPGQVDWLGSFSAIFFLPAPGIFCHTSPSGDGKALAFYRSKVRTCRTDPIVRGHPHPSLLLPPWTRFAGKGWPAAPPFSHIR